MHLGLTWHSPWLAAPGSVPVNEILDNKSGTTGSQATHRERARGRQMKRMCEEKNREGRSVSYCGAMLGTRGHVGTQQMLYMQLQVKKEKMT